MSDDFYLNSLKYQSEQLEAQIAETQAQLRYAKANSDYSAGGGYGQQLADLEAQQRNLYDLANRHVQANQPRQSRPLTDTEWQALSPERMASDWGNTVRLTQTSRYAKNIRADDPGLVAGWNEVQRRKARGE